MKDSGLPISEVVMKITPVPAVSSPRWRSENSFMDIGRIKMLDFLACTFGVDTGLVLVGGAIGGLLQPVVSQFTPKNDEVSLKHWVLAPVLGMVAAGFMIYVMANTDTNDLKRLFFFSMLCGLAFPAVLSRAIKSLDPESKEVKKDAEIISKNAKNGNEGAAANQLERTMSEHPASAKIDFEVREMLEGSAKQLTEMLVNKARGDASSAPEVVEHLKQIGIMASSSGYGNTALNVGRELAKISSSGAVTQDVKISASEAHAQVVDVPPSL